MPPLFLAGPELVARAGLSPLWAGRHHPPPLPAAGGGGGWRCRQAGNQRTTSLPHANNLCTRDANSRQQKPRHTVIKVDSIHEAWVPPHNFPLCLQIEEGNMADSIQLLPVP